MKLLPLFLLIFYTNQLVAQKKKMLQEHPISIMPKPPAIKAFMGIGAGLDYGGLGVKANLEWKANYDLFIGLGSNFNGLGYNLGFMWKPYGHKSVSPIISFLYGFNSVLILKDQMGNDILKKTYYGPSLGFGGRFKMGAKRINHLSLMVIYPIRSTEFYNDVKSINGTYFPVSLSVGYNFRLSF